MIPRTPRTVTHSVLGNLYGLMLLVVTVISEGLLLLLTAQLYIKNNFVSVMWHFPCPALGVFLRVRAAVILEIEV